MSELVQVEGLYKKYRLGVVNRGMLWEDMRRWWKRRGERKVVSEHPLHQRLEGDEFWALRDVSFSVSEGQTLGVMGKNGAGKSTLLKILSRTTSPTLGNVRTKGRMSSLLEVGTGFHPELTGRENVFLNGAILGMSRQEVRNKFSEIVEFSEVGDFLDTPVKRYSSGMYVRLAFAVAAHLDPQILILDEVLAVGDAKFQKKCMDKLNTFVNSGKTILFVSHNTHAIRSFCSRVVVLKDGEITFDGETSDGVAHYLASLKMSADSSLEKRLNRSNGALRFDKIECRSSEGTEGWNIPKGSDSEFHFHLKAYSEIKEAYLYVALISSESGALVTNIVEKVPIETLDQGDELSLRLWLKTSLLRPGVFSTYICICDESMTQNYDMVDANIDLPPLIVEGYDKEGPKRHGFFEIDSQLKGVEVMKAGQLSIDTKI